MTRDELAEKYIAEKLNLVKRAFRLYYRSLSEDDLDDLYSDCWSAIERAQSIHNIDAYIWSAFHNKVRTHLRDRGTSHDAFDYAYYGGNSDLPFPDVEDTRLYEAVVAEITDWRVAETMSKIPTPLTYVGWAVYVDNRTCKQLSLELQRSESNIKRVLIEFKRQFTEIYLNLANTEPSWTHFP